MTTEDKTCLFSEWDESIQDRVGCDEPARSRDIFCDEHWLETRPICVTCDQKIMGSHYGPPVMVKGEWVRGSMCPPCHERQKMTVVK